MKYPKCIAALLLFLSPFLCCQKSRYKLYPDIELRPTSKKGSFPSKQTIQGLLYEIWESGFIRKNEITKKEILDNAYGIFRKAPKILSEPEGRAYYQNREGKKDLLMLNARLFGHLEPEPKQPHMDKVRIRKLDRRILATIVHELFHDFWHNVLDGRDRYLFAAEAEIFFIGLIVARAERLKQAGPGRTHPDYIRIPDDETFDVLLEILDIYSLDKVSKELYSVLAGQAFSGKSIIPQPFRKYYAVLISDDFLKTSGSHPSLHYPNDSGDIEDGLETIIALCSWTPLFLASFTGDLESAEGLIKTGAPVDSQDNRGRTPLHIAAFRGHRELIGLLLQQGANIGSKDAAGMTPLHWAALGGRKTTASFLLDQGADEKAKDYSSQTPLHLASFCGDEELAALLIDEGAAVDAQDIRRETALHVAAFCGHQKAAERLMERGASPGIKNVRGETPLDIASKSGHEKIEKILRRADY